MHNPESVLENQMGSPNLGYMTRLLIIKKKKKKKEKENEKKNLKNSGLCCPGWPQSKI